MGFVFVFFAAFLCFRSVVSAETLQGIVTVDGTQFVVDRKPFYFVGANLNVMHSDEVRQRAKFTLQEAASDRITVGRIWALGEGLPTDPAWKIKDYFFRAGPDGWQETAYQHLDFVLDEASKLGIRVVVTLSNHWSDYGGIPMYLKWAGYSDEEMEQYGHRDRFFQNEKVRHWFLDHVRRIVTRVNRINGRPYREDPTIFAWELQNEMQGTPEAATARREWIVNMIREIKALDPNHMVVPGTIGYNLQLERGEWIAINQLPEVSYCDQHTYPEEHLRSSGLNNLKRFIDDRVQLAHHVIKKPIVFGEFGFAHHDAKPRRVWWHDQFLKRLLWDGGNGALVWIYQPTLSWGRKYGILVDQTHDRPLRNVIKRYATRMAREIPRAKNPVINARRGSTPISPTHASIRGDSVPHRGWSKNETLTSGWLLTIPVEKFARGYFEDAGVWGESILVHAYGRRTGWFEYRFVRPPKRGTRMVLSVRLSSEYPSRYAPPHGFSRVRILLNDEVIDTLRVPPDNGIGDWFDVFVEDPEILKSVFRRSVNRLRFEVVEGEEANGVVLYGDKNPKSTEKVDHVGPMRIMIN